MVTIALARDAEDESRIERALEEAGIEYAFTLDAAEGSGVCFLARSYEVEERDAERARAAIAQAREG